MIYDIASHVFYFILGLAMMFKWTLTAILVVALITYLLKNGND